MEQKLFEELIAPYATKVEYVVPKYTITTSFQVRKINVKNHKDQGRPRKGKAPQTVITPDGTFNSAKECAEYYKRSRPWVYGRIVTGEFKSVKQR